MPENNKVTRIQSSSIDARIHQAQKSGANERYLRREARQVGTEELMEQQAERMTQSTRDLQKEFKPLKEQVLRNPENQKTEKSENKENTSDAEATKQLAGSYNKRNPELQKTTLLLLVDQIKPDDTEDEVIDKLQKTFGDKFLADEALDFLIEVSKNKKEVSTKLTSAKEKFNSQFGREIRSGRNISAHARSFSEKGLGSPTGLRDLYREITGNPRDPHTLFDELTQKFKFSDMKNIIDFILHSLGSDMKSKGPSISKGELQRLFGESRTMQAILGLFRFFYNRMPLINSMFNRYDLSMPSKMKFDVLARLLMLIIKERYPTPDKVLQQALTLGIAEEFNAQIIVFTQYRDAMRNLSPKLFKSDRHRQELLMTFIETLSDLEDELDEEEE